MAHVRLVKRPVVETFPSRKGTRFAALRSAIA
jgi:hypothetical protein